MVEYKEFLASKGIQSKPTASGCEVAKTPQSVSLVEQVEGLFKTLDSNSDGLISSQDAERLLLKLNSTYGRNYGESESKAFFTYLATNNLGTTRDGSHLLDLNTFKRAFGLDQL